MKESYRQFCQHEPSIPLFSRPWWLDAVAGDNWDVALVQKQDEVVAAMPYQTKSVYGFKAISQPPLTPCLGPWLKTIQSKYSKRLGKEKDWMEALIAQLPPYDYFAQNWHHSRTNWLPFFWEGFQQTTRYTYRLESLLDLNQLWSDLQENVRREIRKASQREALVVRDDLGIGEFYELNRKVFERQGKTVPYSEDFVHNLDRATSAQNARRIFIAEDTKGRRHAGIYLVWDEHSAYYLMGGGDPELRNSGATSLCMWEAIKFAATITQSFDFEGSMIEPVERFFRGFGAKQTPYHAISHTPSRLIKTALMARDVIKG